MKRKLILSVVLTVLCISAIGVVQADDSDSDGFNDHDEEMWEHRSDYDKYSWAFDSDKDPTYEDVDSDNDNLRDEDETGQNGISGINSDIDDDGIPNPYDPDSDNDGIRDGVEENVDDKGIPEYKEQGGNESLQNDTDVNSFKTFDEDNDGMADRLEPERVPPKPETGEKVYGHPGETVTLNASNSTDNGKIKSYKWKYGAWSRKDEGETGNFSFNTVGTKKVDLVVTDLAGNQNSTEVWVEIKPYQYFQTSSDRLVFDTSEVSETGERTITVSQSPNASGPVKIEEMSVTGPDSREFEYIIEKNLIQPGESADLKVKQVPKTPGEKNATVEIKTNSTNREIGLHSKVDEATDVEEAGSDRETETKKNSDAGGNASEGPEDGSSGETTGDRSGGEGQPGFGFAATISALTGTALLARRRLG
ncbi:MAG: PKD domain-containing protein [Halobacteria archaeon]